MMFERLQSLSSLLAKSGPTACGRRMLSSMTASVSDGHDGGYAWQRPLAANRAHDGFMAGQDACAPQSFSPLDLESFSNPWMDL